MTGPPNQREAPELPGYTFRSVLGRGGFADVFLYEQDRARRDVAVKVLREPVDRHQDRAAITAEAEVMAQLSTHPYIVTIYDADVAPDGRPYLVMEYYSRPNFARRARNAGFDVPETLRVGVQVASAVETAHRAGIVHRDIKPANLLTSDYGRPGLTDFGIATRSGIAAQEDGALSIPWAAPELFRDGVVLDRRADIYALGATLWTLLVGRSPFEAPGGDNSEMVLWYRIENAPLPQTGRADAPASLERVLRQAMAKHPEERFATALDFARELQSIQGELQHAVEPVALPDLGLTTSRPKRPAAPSGEESVVTVLRSPRVARSRPDGAGPGSATGPGTDGPGSAAGRGGAEGLTTARPAGRPPAVAGPTIARPPAGPPPAGRPPAGPPSGGPASGGPAFVGPAFGGPPPARPPGPAGRARTPLPPESAPAPPVLVAPARPAKASRPAATRRRPAGRTGRRPRRAALAGLAAVLVATGGGVVLWLHGRGDGTTGAPQATSEAGGEPTSGGDITVARVLDGSAPVPVVTAERTGPTAVRFSWKVTDPTGVSGYLVTRDDPGRGTHPVRQRINGTSIELTGLGSKDRPCLLVSATDRSGNAGTARRLCAT